MRRNVRPVGGKRSEPSSRRALYAAWGWNQYVKGRFDPQTEAQLKMYTIQPLDIEKQFKGDEDRKQYIEELLMQYAACTTLMKNQHHDLTKYADPLKPPSMLNMKQLITAQKTKALQKIESDDLLRKAVPDYLDRIQKYHQSQHIISSADGVLKRLKNRARLAAVIQEGAQQKKEDESDKRAAEDEDEQDKKAAASDSEQKAQEPEEETTPAGQIFSRPSSPTRIDDLEFQAHQQVVGEMGEMNFMLMSAEDQRQTIEYYKKQILNTPKGDDDRARIAADVNQDEAYKQHTERLIAEANTELERYMRSGILYQHQPHDRNLQADAVHRGNIQKINQMHLMQTDNNIAPVMGRVHLVRPQQGFSDKHFMMDVHGDINEGQRTLIEKSRKGPFKDRGGRSTIYDSTAHTMYRGRRGIFEITVKRGVSSSELQRLASKLNVHSLSQKGSRIVLIKGGRRYVLGFLRDLDIRHIMSMVRECIGSYGACGLELSEDVQGTGALHNPHVHGMKFKSSARRARGSMHRR